MSTSTSCPIPGGRDRLPDCYSTTPGGTLYATTPGAQAHAPLGNNLKLGTVLERKGCHALLSFGYSLRTRDGRHQSPTSFFQVPEVTVPPQAPLAKIKELKEQKETEEIPDEAQFEMDI